MRSGKTRKTLGWTAALSAAVVLGLVPTPVQAAQDADPLPEISPPRSASLSAGPSVEDFAHLEVREDELVLTNISDRPFTAWGVKTVLRSSQGNEASGYTMTDAYRAPIRSSGEEGLLQPGESVSFPKGAKPWLREDHRGPGAGVYYEIGVLTFEGGDAVGDSKLVERIFSDRLKEARSALKAIEVAHAAASAEAGKAVVLDDLPAEYRRYLDIYANQEEALFAVRNEALEEYSLAVDNLRLKDLAELPLPAEVPK